MPRGTIFLLSGRTAFRSSRGALSDNRKVPGAIRRKKRRRRGRERERNFDAEIIKVHDKSARSIPFT